MLDFEIGLVDGGNVKKKGEEVKSSSRFHFKSWILDTAGLSS